MGTLRLRRSDKFGDQPVLGVVGVLVLVDEHVTESPSVVLGDVRVGGEEPDHLADEVVEIDRVGAPQPRLVLGVDLRDGHREPVRGAGRLCRGARRIDEFVLQVRDGVRQSPRGELLGVESPLLRDHPEQPAGIVRVVDAEVRVQAVHEARLLTQDTDAGGVEGGHPHTLSLGPHQTTDAFPHLGGGLVGEGDGEDLPRMHTPVREQIGDAPGQHRGLAGSGARDDQQRAAGVFHRGPLLIVEPLDEIRRGAEGVGGTVPGTGNVPVLSPSTGRCRVPAAGAERG